MFSFSFKVAVWTLHHAAIVQNAVANPEDRATLGSDLSAAVGPNTAGLGGRVSARPNRPPAGLAFKR